MENITDKKRAIFESTLDLIKDHGFHGAPMSLVAKNAGVAAGTIYHYFESKDELIGELYAYNKNRVVEIVEKTIAEGASYKEKFFNLWANLYAFYIQNKKVLIFFEQYINSPYNTNKCPNHFQGQLFSFFSEGIEKGLVKPAKPELLMLLVMGSITSAAKLNLFGNIPFNEKDLKQIIEILWDGIALH